MILRLMSGSWLVLLWVRKLLNFSSSSLVEEINFISYCGNSRPHLFSVITTALKSEWNHYNLKIP